MRRSATPRRYISPIRKLAFLSSDLPVRISLPMTTMAAVFCRIPEILSDEPVLVMVSCKSIRDPIESLIQSPQLARGNERSSDPDENSPDLVDAWNMFDRDSC